jgi:hypothetical protein
MMWFEIAYALAVVAAFVLAGGGLWLWRRDRKRALLMIAVSAVTLANVWSWSSLRVEADRAVERDQIGGDGAGGDGP